MRPLPDLDLHAAFREAGPAVRELRGARLLITGASGFFGRWLVETLAWANRSVGSKLSVIAVARDAARLAQLQSLCAGLPLQVLACDVRELPSTLSFSHAAHLASASAHDFDAHNASEQSQVVVEGTRRVAELAADQSARLLLASSGAVYGLQPLALAQLDEEQAELPAPGGARTAYGVAKRKAEQLAIELGQNRGFCVNVARCFSFVGPAQPIAPYAIGQFIEAALASRPIVVRGAPDTVRSYLYASDLCAWLLRVLTLGTPGRIYNVGGGEPVSMRELAELVARELGGSARFEPAAGATATRYVPAVARAERELGCSNSVPLARAVQQTATWFTEAA